MYEFVAVTATLALTLGACVRVVVDGEAGLVERRGEYRRTITGVGLVWPILERVRIVPLHRYRMHLAALPLRTGVGQDVFVDVDVAYETTDPVRATYAVPDLHPAVEDAVREGVRLLVGFAGGPVADRTLAPALRERLEPLSEWGLTLHDVRVRTRIPPVPTAPPEAAPRRSAGEEVRSEQSGARGVPVAVGRPGRHR